MKSQWMFWYDSGWYVHDSSTKLQTHFIRIKKTHVALGLCWHTADGEWEETEMEDRCWGFRETGNKRGKIKGTEWTRKFCQCCIISSGASCRLRIGTRVLRVNPLWLGRRSFSDYSDSLELKWKSWVYISTHLTVSKSPPNDIYLAGTFLLPLQTSAHSEHSGHMRGGNASPQPVEQEKRIYC